MLPCRHPRLVFLAASFAISACGGKTLAEPTVLDNGASASSSMDSGSSGTAACTLGPLPTSVAPGAPSGPLGESSAWPCDILGTWDLTNAPQGSDPPNQGSILFRADGDWFGGDYKEDVCATEFMYGLFSFDGTTLAFPNESAIGVCPAGSPATWSVNFKPDCSHATLQAHLDDCTGARLYMEDATVLVRRQ